MHKFKEITTNIKNKLIDLLRKLIIKNSNLKRLVYFLDDKFWYLEKYIVKGDNREKSQINNIVIENRRLVYYIDEFKSLKDLISQFEKGRIIQNRSYISLFIPII